MELAVAPVSERSVASDATTADPFEEPGEEVDATTIAWPTALRV